MANPIKRGFSKLTQFSGRDTRGEFWPYVGAVFALVFILQGVGMSWMMSDVFADVQTYAAANPETTTVTTGPGSYSIQVDRVATADVPMPDFRIFNGVLIVSVGLAVTLIAAAVSRRLHDRNIRGYWGLIPLPFVLTGVIGMTLMMGSVLQDGAPDFGLFGLLFLNNVLYMVSLVTLIVLLAQKGTPGPNRYGAPTIIPEPVNDLGRTG